MYKIPTTARIVFALYLILVLTFLSTVFKIDLRLGTHSFIAPAFFFFAIIPFWLLLILKSNKLLKGSSKDYLLKKIKSSLPSWILKFTIVNIVFGVGNFFLGFVTKNFESVFLSHLAIFYSVTFAGLTGMVNLKQERCANGHELKMDAQFCPVCGIKI